MPIKVELPNNKYDVNDLVLLVQEIALFAEVTSITSTQIRADMTFPQPGTTVVATGFGINANATRGQVDKLAFKIGDDKIVMKSLKFKLAEFDKAIVAEDSGRDPRAIEKFLLKQDWNVQFKSGDEFFPSTFTVGDGQKWNPKGDDIFRMGGGNDTFFTGNGDDRAYGVAGNDELSGGKGEDSLYGGKGRDILSGDANRDLLVGGSSNDELFGGGAADVLNGGKQKDMLFGGGGADIFVFRTGDSKDTIFDFDANNDNEEIDLSAVKAIKDWNDLRKNHMDESFEGVVISDNNGLEITLNQVDINDLNKTDFIF